MPSTESDIIQAALALPNGLREFLDTKIPTIEDIESPSNPEDAMIAMGKLSANVNKILQAFTGLKPVQLQLRISQYHPSVIGMMCGGLETISGSGTFDVLAPKDGGIYPGFFDSWTVQATGVESVSISLAGETFELICNDDLWSAKWPVPIGNHTATVTAGEDTAVVSFSVVSWETFPAEGGTYTPADIDHTSIDLGELEDVESVSVLLFGKSIELMQEAAGIWSAGNLTWENVSEGGNKAVYSILTGISGTIQAVVEFGIDQLEG